MTLPNHQRVTDHRLIAAYHEANQLDEAGIEAICPLYLELSEVETRYRDESILAQGGSKEVSKVYDSRTKKWLAMARPRHDLGPEHLDRFVHEAWLTSSLAHPNIINIYDVGVDAEGQPYFTMDLKSNRTLASQLSPEDEHPLDQRELLVIFAKICDAIAYAHSRGILHLDLKPDNIQIDRFGEVLVCDWGLGTAINDESDLHEWPIPATEAGTIGMTLDGEIKGTPGFMAPEQTDPHGNRDERTDAFSLGCILYAIVTKSPVFTAKSSSEILNQTSAGYIIPPHVRFPEKKIPASLEAVVMKAVALDPSNRYSSVDELRQEISRYLAGYTTIAENPGFSREVVSFVARNQLASAISLIALISLTVLGVLSVQGIQLHQELAKIEHERADHLQIKAESLERTAETLASQIDSSHQARIDFANDIANSCKTISNSSIFNSANPLTMHRQISDLAETASAIDPKNLTANIVRFRLANYQMNFAKSSSLVSGIRPHVPPNQAWIAEHFSKFAFNEQSRPTIPQLVAFLLEAEQRTTEPSAFIDTILSYDVLARKETDDYGPVIQTFLHFINQDWHPENFHFDHQERSLRIRVSPGFKFDTYDAANPVIRHLKLKSLKLECDQPVDLSSLHLLPIKSLDLRSCNLSQLEESRTLAFIGLVEVHVTEGKFELNTLRRKLRSDKPYKIIEHPSDS